MTMKIAAIMAKNTGKARNLFVAAASILSVAPDGGLSGNFTDFETAARMYLYLASAYDKSLSAQPDGMAGGVKRGGFPAAEKASSIRLFIPVPSAARMGTALMPRKSDSLSQFISMPRRFAVSDMLRAITMGMLSSISCVVR